MVRFPVLDGNAVLMFLDERFVDRSTLFFRYVLRSLEPRL